MKLMKLIGVSLLLLILGQSIVVASSNNNSSSSTLKVKFYSESLEKFTNMNVYLPANYDAQDKYPVLYVLHSYKLNEDHWFDALKVAERADALIEAGKIEPMIIVAPRIDNSFGVNSTSQKGYIEESGKPGDAGVLHTGKYEDYITRDVVSYVDTHFNTIKLRNSRYLAGTSMGGFAALHIGLSNPNLYSKVGGHSPALFVGEMWAALEKLVFPTKEKRADNDPFALANSQKLNKLNIYLDMGDEDDFKDKTTSLSKALHGVKTKSIEFHVNKGKHDDAYWSSQIDNYLLYYAGMDRE